MTEEKVRPRWFLWNGTRSLQAVESVLPFSGPTSYPDFLALVYALLCRTVDACRGVDGHGGDGEGRRVLCLGAQLQLVVEDDLGKGDFGLELPEPHANAVPRACSKR